MKRRNVIRNIAAGSLLVSGVGSAEALNRGSGSTVYKLRKDGDTFRVVETFHGDVGIQHHCPDNKEECCVEDCCDCADVNCGFCVCHDDTQECDDDGGSDDPIEN